MFQNQNKSGCSTFIFLAKTLEIKAADSVKVSTITPFLRRGLVSVLIIPCSETLWGIQGTFGFPRKFNKSILSSFSTTSSIKQSLVKTFQFSLMFLMLLATNSDLLLLLLNEFSFCEIYCSALLSISSLEQSPSVKTTYFLKYWLQMSMLVDCFNGHLFSFLLYKLYELTVVLIREVFVVF